MHTITYDKLFGAPNHERHYVSYAKFRSACATLRDLGWDVHVNGSNATANRPHERPNVNDATHYVPLQDR